MSSARGKWSSQDTISFLEMYEQHRCLWDVHSEGYKDRNTRINAYEAMATAMEIDGFLVEDVKAKIRSLRNAYTLELAKILRSKKLAAGPDDVYKPKLPWFPVADRILNGVVQLREIQPTEIGVADSETQSSVNDVVETVMVDPTPPTAVPGVSTEAIPSTSKRTFTSDTAEPARKKAKTSATNYQRCLDRTLSELKNISASLSKKIAPKEEDEFDMFGKLIACQLKKLPIIVALEAQQYIFSYLIQKRIEHIRRTNRQYDAASPDSAMESSHSDADIPSQEVGSADQADV
ncbi:uncharacterized protein LOC126884240 [Diabrotica virgifera virgifera]|uniref:Uncharacterized protein LOC114324499 n=1 Tax=Diabrotica virgifera virgifera TaxID=50390 RepID=A0A6P7EY75_DIAVI|nr:uncharacterized protein LOC126884240 [Diabrotica virgifera virgifera]